MHWELLHTLPTIAAICVPKNSWCRTGQSEYYRQHAILCIKTCWVMAWWHRIESCRIAAGCPTYIKYFNKTSNWMPVLWIHDMRWCDSITSKDVLRRASRLTLWDWIYPWGWYTESDKLAKPSTAGSQLPHQQQGNMSRHKCRHTHCPYLLCYTRFQTPCQRLGLLCS